VDGAGLFALALAQGSDGHAALRACVDATWNATRAVVNHAFLVAPGGDEERPAGRGGRIVYLAPSADAGEHAEAACAGLENLARTLSIEWARYGITTVTIAPGAQTPAGEVAALTAYLASPAGAYFSGCLLDLRGP
jgi:NAD(P)-dependent dehydrogenase (short-subunit alcohol dehydrogenase family)